MVGKSPLSDKKYIDGILPGFVPTVVPVCRAVRHLCQRTHPKKEILIAEGFHGFWDLTRGFSLAGKSTHYMILGTLSKEICWQT